MTGKQIMFVGVALVLVVAAYFAGSQRQAAANAQRLAQLEDRQRALETGVLNGVSRAQLASQLGYAPPPSRNAPDMGERSQPTPEEAARVLQDKLAKLDQQFMAEPLDAKWAGETKASVEDSIVGAAAETGVQPRSLNADCRSKSCMIQMEVASGTDMDRVLDTLTTDISGKLPVTTMIPVTGPDGRVTMHIYGTQSAPGKPAADPRG
jgi:hypothetical protein